MKFYCLTSVELEPNNFTENEKIIHFKNYSLTCIEIGPNKQRENVFTFQRENAEKISLLMKPGSITIISIDWKVTGIIDLEFSEDANFPDKYCQIKSMRISNIKITKNTNISDDEKQKYYDLTVKLNQVINNNADSIKLIKETKFYNAQKSLRNRLQDIDKLISHYCGPDAQNVTEEASVAAKYLPTAELKDDEKIFIDKENYHQRQRDNKIPWSKLTFSYVTMPRFDYVWFDAINLKELNLLNVKIFDTTDDAWKLFASGMERLKFLKKLVINGNFNEISNIVFQKLPESLNILILYNLNYISENIYRLKNLRELSLIGNEAMANLPWNHLPESIMKLELIGTGIAEIPHNISRFVNLEFLRFTERYPSNSFIDSKEAYLREKQRFQDKTTVKISWASINKNIKYLYVSHVENLDDLRNCNFTLLEEIIITNSQSEEFDSNLLSKNLRKISLFKNKISTFKCDFDFDYSCLNELDLSGNYISGKYLKEFPSECITKPMAKVNLSKNFLTKFVFNKFVTNIKFLDLSWNTISSVIIDDGWNEDVETKEGMILNLSHNEIMLLPSGFEKLPIKELNVCQNLFSIKNYEKLNVDLWKRLPENLTKLNISKNRLFDLPCLLQNLLSLTEIIAMDCQIDTICPWIFGGLLSDKKCLLDIRNNLGMVGLPFAPSKIFPHIQNLSKPIKCEKELEDYKELSDIYDEMPTITWSNYYDDEIDNSKSLHENGTSKILINKKFLNLQQTKTIDLIFQPKYLHKWEFCKCCAKCGDETEDDPIVEQLMSVDYGLFQEELKDEEFTCNYWVTKTWKTTLITRFCESCIRQYKEELKELKLTNSKRKVLNDQLTDNFNDEFEPDMGNVDTITITYTDPQPCNSRTKLKKIGRREVPVHQQPDNNHVNSRNPSQIITNAPILIKLDAQTIPQSYNHVTQTNMDQNLQIAPHPTNMTQEHFVPNNNYPTVFDNPSNTVSQQNYIRDIQSNPNSYHQNLYNAEQSNAGIYNHSNTYQPQNSHQPNNVYQYNNSNNQHCGLIQPPPNAQCSQNYPHSNQPMHFQQQQQTFYQYNTPQLHHQHNIPVTMQTLPQQSSPYPSNIPENTFSQSQYLPQQQYIQPPPNQSLPPVSHVINLRNTQQNTVPQESFVQNNTFIGQMPINNQEGFTSQEHRPQNLDIENSDNNQVLIRYEYYGNPNGNNNN